MAWLSGLCIVRDWRERDALIALWHQFVLRDGLLARMSSGDSEAEARSLVVGAGLDERMEFTCSCGRRLERSSFAALVELRNEATHLRGWIWRLVGCWRRSSCWLSQRAAQ